MKRLAIFVILLCVYQSSCLLEAEDKYSDQGRREQFIRGHVASGLSFDVARTHYQELLQKAETTGDERMQAEYLFQIASILYWQAQFSVSLTEAKKGLAIALRLNNNELLSVGYDLLARLHYLFSTEQAQYYYRKCWEYGGRSDSAELTVVNLNSYNMIRDDKEIPLEELLSIDIQSLRPLSRAWLGYNIARALFVEGRVNEAAHYLSYTQDYLQQHGRLEPLGAMYEHRMGQLRLLEGNPEEAWKYMNQSLETDRKNKVWIGIVNNYQLASEIAHAEGKEDVALDFYKKSVELHDSIFNSTSNQYFPDDLVYSMMENITGEEIQSQEKTHLLAHGLSALGMIGAVCLLYYFRAVQYRKKTKTAITDIKNHHLNGFHSKMKSHLMKIMYAYKAGVNYCLKHVLEIQWDSDKPEPIDYFAIFEKNMQKADELMDTLLDRVEAESDIVPEKKDFDIKKTVERIIALHTIGFAPKHITYHVSMEQPAVACGDRDMFAIAVEHLFFRTIKAALKNAAVSVAVVTDSDGYATVGIADPGNNRQTIENELFAQRIAQLGPTNGAMRTADWDFNIFAECTMINDAKIRMEHSPEKGTTYYYSMLVVKP